MPNYYHLLLETPRGNLLRAMRHLYGVYTQRYKRVHGSDGTLFRGRYKAILIDKDNYLLQVVRYIHLNPVQAKIVKEPADHPWTSHRYYAGKGGSPVGLVMEGVLGQFHKRRRQAIKWTASLPFRQPLDALEGSCGKSSWVFGVWSFKAYSYSRLCSFGLTYINRSSSVTSLA